VVRPQVRCILLLALASAVWGCPAKPAEPTPPPQILPKEDVKPATTPPVSEAQNAPTAPPKENAVQQVKPGTNDARIHQLYDLKVVKVTIGGHTFKSWVMDDDSSRSEGMMFLEDKDVKADQGMLFAFPDEIERSFWMKNTYIDLDIAYIAKNGKVVSVKTMKAHDEAGVPSEGAAMYALEVKAGTFKRAGIRKGMTATISPPVKGS